jgi:hypothetical protein
MTAKLIHNNDNSYITWTKTNPQGYVLNIGADNNPNYRTLHRTSCSSITNYQKDKPEGAFTCRGYRKVVAPTIQELVSWVENNRGGNIKRCTRCNPPPLEPLNLDHLREELEAQVKESTSNPSARKKRLETAPTKPEQIKITIITYRRNADVIAEVLERANGLCELCKTPAPFIRTSNGTPYLEVHHQKRLADDGDDSVANAIALCPNCHRKSHYC